MWLLWQGHECTEAEILAKTCAKGVGSEYRLVKLGNPPKCGGLGFYLLFLIANIAPSSKARSP